MKVSKCLISKKHRRTRGCLTKGPLERPHSKDVCPQIVIKYTDSENEHSGEHEANELMGLCPPMENKRAASNKPFNHQHRKSLFYDEENKFNSQGQPLRMQDRNSTKSFIVGTNTSSASTLNAQTSQSKNLNPTLAVKGANLKDSDTRPVSSRTTRQNPHGLLPPRYPRKLQALNLGNPHEAQLKPVTSLSTRNSSAQKGEPINKGMTGLLPECAMKGYRLIPPVTKKKGKTLCRVEFQRKNTREALPLLVINFDGVIGDLICPNLFSGDTMLKYTLRQGTEKALKVLQSKYQIAIVRKMESGRFLKFKEYLMKKGIEFDAEYKDHRKESRKYPQDYSQIIEDFCINKDMIQSTIVLACYDTEPDSFPKSQILDHTNIGQLPLCYMDNTPITVLLPHIKQAGYASSNMECIAKSISRITSALSKKLPEIPSPEKHGKAGIELHRSFRVPTSNGKPKSPQRRFPKDPIVEKLSSLNTDFFILHTDSLHKRVQDLLEQEAKLHNRWVELKSKRKAATSAAVEPDKNKATKTEMLSNLMNSKLAAYECLHLANQYSRIVQSVYGKLSEGAISELNGELHIINNLDYLKDCNNKKGDNVLLVLANQGGSAKIAEVIAAEQYTAPYLNLGGFFAKKPIAVGGRKKSYDPDMDSVPTSDMFSITVKRKV